METERRPELPDNITGDQIRISALPILDSIVNQLTNAWNYASLLYHEMPIAPQLRRIERVQEDWRNIRAYAQWKQKEAEANFKPRAWKFVDGELQEMPFEEPEIPEEDWETEPDPDEPKELGSPDPLDDPMTFAKWPKEQDPDYWQKHK